jgi:hypothetical protein
MKKEQILGLIRHLLTFVGGLAIAKGLIDQVQETELVGAICTIIGTVWSVLAKKPEAPVTPDVEP